MNAKSKDVPAEMSQHQERVDPIFWTRCRDTDVLITLLPANDHEVHPLFGLQSLFYVVTFRTTKSYDPDGSVTSYGKCSQLEFDQASDQTIPLYPRLMDQER